MSDGHGFSIIVGDAREVIPSLPVVHCVVTSPPYFGKMRYGPAAQEIGHEDSPDSYVNALCDLFSEIPLHELGSIWVNIGDKRGSDGGLIGIPSMFSLEMRRRGFLLMDDVIWAKGITQRDGKITGNFMTEPAPNRLNGNGWEPIFRFTRTRRAWTDMQAVAVPRYNVTGPRHLPPYLMTIHTDVEGRRPTNVWQMPLGKSKIAHFATFPCDIAERSIAMTCPPYLNPDQTLATRMVTMMEYDEGKPGVKRVFGKYNTIDGDDDGEMRDRAGRQDAGRSYVPRKPVTVGWDNICDGAIPGTVLDPFAGIGTVGEVALRMGRGFIGIELYDEFAGNARECCQAAEDEMRRQAGWDMTPERLRR